MPDRSPPDQLQATAWPNYVLLYPRKFQGRHPMASIPWSGLWPGATCPLPRQNHIPFHTGFSTVSQPAYLTQFHLLKALDHSLFASELLDHKWAPLMCTRDTCPSLTCQAFSTPSQLTNLIHVVETLPRWRPRVSLE